MWHMHCECKHIWCEHMHHCSHTVPVGVWLPEPAQDRGSKQETLNDDFYHTTSRSTAIFGVQGGLSYLVLALTLWIGLCPMKRSSGVWSFGDVSVTYRRSFGNHTLAGTLCSGNILPEPALISQHFRCFTGHSLIMFQYLAVHFDWYVKERAPRLGWAGALVGGHRTF